MLSILIPVYNFSVLPMVQTLHRQGQRLSIEWEILCYDDGSDLVWREQNKGLARMDFVRYVAMKQNIGRSAIRNKLAQDAKGDYLLFLDNDSGILSDQFLQQYVQHLPSPAVLYGGRIYADSKPSDPLHILHWIYGHERESLAVGQRKKHPYHSFMTNNFCVERKLFLAIGLDEQIKTYGHEDTLFGLQLQQRDIPIEHIDNPVIHLGLEDQTNFLAKQKEAIQNLSILQAHYPDFSTRLTKSVQRLRTWKMAAIAKRVLQRMLPQIEQNLRSDHPKMRYLNLWKLYHAL